MTATVSQGAVAGFESIVLENSRVRAVIIPRLGGRVWELLDRRRGRQWIWHREGVLLGATPPGSVYDEVWAGGWEELFPNDAPGYFEGRSLPDHGEWWSTAWKVAEVSQGAEAVVRLTARTQVRETTCTKELRIADDTERIQISYRIESQEPESFHFLFKQHLAIAISPSCSLMLPGGRVTAVEPRFGTVLPGPGPFEWPQAEGVDLRRVPPRSNTAREFVYVTDLPAGWCGVDDAAQGASLRLEYDAAHFQQVWLFLSYGGWRDCYTAVLEPCTNIPKDLAEAVRAGRSARLPAGGVFETSVTAVLGKVPA